MSLKEKAVVLLSGGLDSTVSLAEAKQQYDVVLALTFNYGQRAFGKEYRASRYIAEYYRVPQEMIPLPWLSQLLPQPLRMRKQGQEPVIPEAWGENAPAEDSFFEAKPVWVPNRNGLFLNIAATYAEALEAQVIIFGANAEEGERFPDNTEAFRAHLNEVFAYSTLSGVRVESPMGLLNKAQIIERAKALDVPLHMVWSCYTDAESQCGQCPSCYRLKRALEHFSQDDLPAGKSLTFIH